MIKLAFLIAISFTFNQSLKANEDSSKAFHYYCIASDESYFPMLIGLIGSIHKVDFDALDEIAVFDIGLTPRQKDIIENIEKTKLYQVEKVHPYILNKFTTHPDGKKARGWYTWKPIILKQALDMFPYFLYLDAGTLVLKSLDNLFQHIKQNGYFLIEIPPHSIEERITKPVIEKVLKGFSKQMQEDIMKKDTYMIISGVQGISKKIYSNYVLPIYDMANDLTLFADDGSARLGFGAGRHDQTLFSIFAYVEKLNLSSQGWSNLKIDGKEVLFHYHWDPREVNDQTGIYSSRIDCNFGGNKTKFIRWRRVLSHSDKRVWDRD